MRAGPASIYRVLLEAVSAAIAVVDGSSVCFSPELVSSPGTGAVDWQNLSRSRISCEKVR
jgi:hypothetical protein